MPAIDPGRESVSAAGKAKGRRKPKPKPVYGPPAPKPKPKPTGVFKPGVPKPATAPITIAQGKAKETAAKAERRLPRPSIAAPPVIRNPTPKQVKAAKQQIVTTIRTAVGTGGTGAQRNARRDALMRQIQTDPKLAQVKRSVNHWSAEDRKIAGPQTRATVKPGPQPRRAKVGIGPISASINLTATGQAITTAAEKAAPGLTRATAEAKFGKAIASDIAHLPLMVPQTAYEVSMAAKEAAGGDTKRAKALAKSFTEGVAGHVIRGDWEGLEDYFREHPVYAILEVRGGKGFTGRGAGAVMRSGAVGGTAKRAASTKRGDLDLSGEGARVADRQHYSPDVITKAFQVMSDRKRQGKPRLGDHRLRRRADFESDMAAAASRAIRGDEGKQAKAAKPKGPLAEVVGLVVQGVVRPKSLEADLRKELARLDEKHATAEFSTGSQKRQNRTTADAIRKVLDSPAAMARIGEVAQSGRANVRAINASEARAVELGAITPERAERAKLFPAAQAHLGAKHGGMTRQQGRQVVAKARTELERARGARDHVMERLRSEGVKKPTQHPDYAKAVQRVMKAKAGLSDARALRRSGAVMLRDPNNDPLPNAVVRQVLGGEDVAYLPHHTKDRGARAYYQTAFAGRKNLDSSKKRTGAAFEKGAVDVGYQAVTEHRVRLRGVVNRIAEHDRIIHSIAIKGPGGRMMTWDQAEKIASNAKDKSATLVPYRAVPGSYDRARMSEIATRQGASEMPALEKMIEHEFAERLKAPAAGDRTAPNVVLVPEQIVNQLQEQHAVSSTRGKVSNVAVDVFRRVVLPFSTKWLMGNIVEAGVRLGAVGAGPNAYRIGRNLLKEMEKVDAEQALRVKAALTGGLLFGNRGLTVKRVSEHFEGTSFAKPAAAVSVAGQLPVVKQLGQLMKGYSDSVFAFNRTIETAAQTAALGKHAKREMQEMTGSWAKATKAQEAALRDVANGLMDSKNIHDAARYIDQTLGQYSRFSPQMRRFIQQAAPFLPWYMNAARWVFWTLPAKHPIKTGIMGLAAQNLQEDFDASHKGLPPGDLRGEAVTDDGTVIPVARYMPFGAFGTVLGGGNEQLTAIVDPLFPQFKSAALAAFGMNFSGKKAKIAPEDREGHDVPGAVRMSMAFNSLLEAFVPVVGIAKRVREGGSTGWDNSTIWDPETKPGTKVKGGAANRILNPFRPSPIKARGAAQAAPAPTPTAAPVPPSLEDELLDNLDQSLGDAQAQQALEDELLDNLYGGG